MFKKAFKLAALFVAAIILGFVAVKTYGDATYFDDYDAALPLQAEVKETTVVADTKEIFGVERPRNYRRTEFSIEARPGDRVPCVITQPLEFEGKLPTIVFVHGSGQDKRFVETICTPFTNAGFAMVSYDQWNRGERKIQEDGLKKALAWYDRGWKAVNDARRIADYLLTRDDVDPERLYLVGASYGAMTGTHILAHDKRFKAGVLVVGGGDFKVMLDAPLIRDELAKALGESQSKLLLGMLKPVARWLGGPFDPVRSAAMTAPTPVLMQCGEDDALVSPDAGRALYAALAEPKEIVWYDIDHPGLRDGDGPEIIRMLDEGLAWLAPKAGVSLTPAPAEQAAAEAEAQAVTFAANPGAAAGE
ncbi:MAG: hypothetical protein RLZZ303_3373 [Candidatus Hydrogenedentota bacterium]|jgi:dienelactone hydrolase